MSRRASMIILAGALLAAAGAAPRPALAQGACTHLGGTVACPAGVATGSISISFINGGLNILWSDNTVTLASQCCGPFVPPAATAAPAAPQAAQLAGGGTGLSARDNYNVASRGVGGGGTLPDWADKNGAVGLGGNTTLGGTNGINFRTYVSPAFGLAGTLGFQFASPDAQSELGGGDASFSTTTFAIGLYVVYKLAYWQRGSLSVLFGGDIESNSTTVDTPAADADESTTNIVIALGVQGEYFPTQYLSLFADTGIRLDFLTDDDAATLGVDADTVDVSGIDLSLTSDLWGGAGFTVWFN